MHTFVKLNTERPFARIAFFVYFFRFCHLTRTEHNFVETSYYYLYAFVVFHSHAYIVHGIRCEMLSGSNVGNITTLSHSLTVNGYIKKLCCYCTTRFYNAFTLFGLGSLMNIPYIVNRRERERWFTFNFTHISSINNHNV